MCATDTFFSLSMTQLFRSSFHLFLRAYRREGGYRCCPYQVAYQSVSQDATVPGQTNKGSLICAREKFRSITDHADSPFSSATRSCPSDRPCFVVVVRDRDACVGCKRLRFCMHTRTAAAAAHPYDGMRCTYLFSFSPKSASVRRFLYGRVLAMVSRLGRASPFCVSFSLLFE